MGPRAQIIAQGTRVFLSFPETIDMVQGHCLIVPNEHVLTLLDCDDDEWTEIRNFQKSVIRMFDTLNKGLYFYLILGVVFIEQVISFHSHRHAVMDCIPIPADFHADSPAYFKVTFWYLI
jgi:diadenosine tetraphosphate (Ap4A) HIT family hydrolase